jgi:hypothetical protein
LGFAAAGFVVLVMLILTGPRGGAVTASVQP